MYVTNYQLTYGNKYSGRRNIFRSANSSPINVSQTYKRPGSTLNANTQDYLKTIRNSNAIMRDYVSNASGSFAIRNKKTLDGRSSFVVASTAYVTQSSGRTPLINIRKLD